ncbi:MAG: HlyD family efflux transporter periplasmic adaptor subunit [Candidatus Nealsonbacteria bacterium]|nr:HlyD family efflux transporter periplasmic adaptor subunit [Candidatus Nealsonbacteria bacterium]
MDSAPPNPPSESNDEAWRQIENLVEQLAELSRSEVSVGEFYKELLDRIVSGLAASGGTVWTRDAGAGLQPRYRINPPENSGGEPGPGWPGHDRLIETVLASDRPQLVPPRSAAAGDDQTKNPTPFLLVLCPWRVDDELAGVIEVFQRPGASPETRRGYLQFLSVICELVTDFHGNRRVRTFQAHAAYWRRFEQYVAAVHSSLDLRQTAYQIANEGRRLIDCDRVSVLSAHGSKCRLLAASGVDTPNRRANTVRQLERLAAAVMACNEPLWYCPGSGDLPPPIERPLNSYVDQTHVRLLAAVLLRAAKADDGGGQSQPLGMLIVERFRGAADDDLRERVDVASRHGALALQNALELRNVPFARPLRMLGTVLHGSRLPKAICVLLAVAAAVIALVAVPADFEVEARGELQPRDQRDVFAPANGVVSSLRVAHAAEVHTNDLLLTLRRPELDLEFQRVWGELQTAQQRLATIEAERLQNPRETEEQRRRYQQLTAEEEELKQWADSLQRQYEIVQKQQSALEVRSPIGGRILTWNIKQLLEARPVQQGQLLTTVANLRGDWVLELEVPGDRIADVLAAEERFRRRAEVTFVLATDPGVVYRGRIEDVAPRVEIAESEQSVVLATVCFDRDDVPKLIPGATVVGKINCGRRSLGYVWLHDLFEAVEAWVLF